jgi:hypothetical protein
MLRVACRRDEVRGIFQPNLDLNERADGPPIAPTSRGLGWQARATPLVYHRAGTQPAPMHRPMPGFRRV